MSTDSDMLKIINSVTHTKATVSKLMARAAYIAKLSEHDGMPPEREEISSEVACSRLRRAEQCLNNCLMTLAGLRGEQ